MRAEQHAQGMRASLSSSSSIQIGHGFQPALGETRKRRAVEQYTDILHSTALYCTEPALYWTLLHYIIRILHYQCSSEWGPLNPWPGVEYPWKSELYFWPEDHKGVRSTNCVSSCSLDVLQSLNFPNDYQFFLHVKSVQLVKATSPVVRYGGTSYYFFIVGGSVR